MNHCRGIRKVLVIGHLLALGVEPAVDLGEVVELELEFVVAGLELESRARRSRKWGNWARRRAY